MTYRYAQMPVYTGLTEEKIKAEIEQDRLECERENLKIKAKNDAIKEKILQIEKSIAEKQATGIKEIIYHVKCATFFERKEDSVANKIVNIILKGGLSDIKQSIQRSNHRYHDWTHEKLSEAIKEIAIIIKDCEISQSDMDNYLEILNLKDSFLPYKYLSSFSSLWNQLKSDQEAYDAELKKYNEYCLAVLNAKKLEETT